MSAAGLRQWLESVVAALNGRPEPLRKWVGRYYGKIIQWREDGRQFFAVFTAEGATLRDGDYPSPELVLSADGATWREIISERHSFEAIRERMKSRRLVVRGNLNEAYNFAKAVEEAL